MNEINVLYEDEHIFVCHKRAGIAVQTRNIRQPDLEKMILNQLSRCGKKPEIYVVHRLDQPVEGVIVFAKTKKAASGLSCQFKQKNNISKEYVAVVEGHFEYEKHRLENYLLKDGKTNTSKVVINTTNGAKSAILDLEVLCSGEENQLVKINLHTGRHHQIRVQLANAGHPIVGDRKYNEKYQNYKGTIETALCSCSLEFRHPSTGKEMKFTVVPEGEIFSQYHDELKKVYN